MNACARCMKVVWGVPSAVLESPGSRSRLARCPRLLTRYRAAEPTGPAAALMSVSVLDASSLNETRNLRDLPTSPACIS